jgi:osmotically inducible protein OsmC
MPIERSAEAIWQGDLKEGRGKVKAGSGSFDFEVTFGRRFGQDPGTNPEELIAAAHAVCYAMALANTLAKKGKPPTRLRTRSVVSLDAGAGGARITRSALSVEGEVEGLSAGEFRQVAEEGEKGCPVSNALRGGLEITLDARLSGRGVREGAARA